jgi:biopolymer transport protein TolR
MQRPEAVKPEINVTPLVDVVLVLLIIFMVVVPQMEAGAAVTLPGMAHPDTVKAPPTPPVTVTMSASGGLYLEKQHLSRKLLLTELQRIRKVAPSRRMMLKADQGLRYGEVRALFRDCAAQGWPGLSLQVGDKRPAPREGDHGG